MIHRKAFTLISSAHSRGAELRFGHTQSPRTRHTSHGDTGPTRMRHGHTAPQTPHRSPYLRTVYRRRSSISSRSLQRSVLYSTHSYSHLAGRWLKRSRDNAHSATAARLEASVRLSRSLSRSLFSPWSLSSRSPRRAASRRRAVRIACRPYSGMRSSPPPPPTSTTSGLARRSASPCAQG